MQNENENEFKHKEGGYGWVVVVTCGFCLGCLFGIDNSFSLLYNQLIIDYNSTSNVAVMASWVGSSTIAIEYMLSIACCVFIDLYDARKVAISGAIICSIGLVASGFVNSIAFYFITYGVILGIGESLLFAAVLSILPHYFDKRLGLANGVLNLIGAILLSTMPFLISYSLKSYGLSKTFFLLSILFMISGLCAISFSPRLPVSTENKWYIKFKNSVGIEIFKRTRFVVWCVSGFFGYVGFAIPLIVISHHSVLNFPNDNPTIVVAVLGTTCGLAGLVFGAIADIKLINPINLHIISYFVCAIVVTCIPYAKSFVELCVLMGFYGIVDGMFLAVIVPISCSISESPKLSNQANGFFLLFLSLPLIIGPPVASFIYETYKSYEYSFYIGGGCCVVACAILMVFYQESFTRIIISKCSNRFKATKVIDTRKEKPNETTINFVNAPTAWISKEKIKTAKRRPSPSFEAISETKSPRQSKPNFKF